MERGNKFMKQLKIALVAGTTEGRLFAEFLEKNQIESHVLVATEYGEKVLPEYKYCKVHVGRFDEMQLKYFFHDCEITHVYDATHPYAKEVTQNCKNACRYLRIPYYRILREELKPEDYLQEGSFEWFDNLTQAIMFLRQTEGNVLVTTGSKETACFFELPDYKKRLYVRILPDEWRKTQLVQKGFEESHILMEQGPFSMEHNLETFQRLNIRYLITKESGVSGGFIEKMQAAEKEKLLVLIVRRPSDSGISLQEAMNNVEKELGD